MFHKIKFSNNEYCPCGSESKYKDCCKKNNEIKINDSKKPMEVQIREIMSEALPKYCLHPDQKRCKGKIKKAHALQNNKIISLLGGESRHVYIMDAKKQPIIIDTGRNKKVTIVPISKTSVNDATTETCFCDYHDNVAFAIIEKGAPPFNPKNNQMCFVYAYKAYIFEYYKHNASVLNFRNLFKEQTPAFKNPMMVKMYRELTLKEKEFNNIKKYFDKNIVNNTFDGLVSCVVEIPQQIHFSVFAYFAPDYDLLGRRIKHTKNNIMHRIAVTAIPEVGKSFILLSCLKEEEYIYHNLFEQLKSENINLIKYYFNLILPLYSENMVISSTLWESWDKETKMAYTFYANQHTGCAKVLNVAVGMGLRNISKERKPQYPTTKIDLFNINQ